MKRMLAILAVLGLGGVVMALNIPTPGGGQPNAPAKLVVHEWGTFTGFAGSDGVHLPIGITVGNDLPAFVFTRREQAQRQGVRLNEFVFDGGKGGGTFALQRMETPVVYFYTPQPRDVSVAVDFPQGQLSEFYPPVRAMTPAFGEGPGEYSWVQREPTTQPAAALAPLAPPRPAKFERGSLDWGVVRIVPQRAGERPAYMPDVPATPEAAAHYRYARETDAATVQFSDRPGERHDERFLFYRGLGDFTLPVTLTAQDDDHYELSNTSGQPIGAALLLRVADGRARFAVYRDIGARQSMTLPAKTVALDEVGDAIVHALIAEGLYEKEARAMVKTWRSQWLGDAGTRVLYTVPRATTDQLLPLRVAPTPDQTVRVLVGRIDVITPPQEARIGSLLASSLTAKTMSAHDAAFLRGFGRFVEPAIERAAALRGGRGGDEGAQTARHEMNRLRSLYYNAPKPAAAPAQAAAAP
jgi:hypothetical protein